MLMYEIWSLGRKPFEEFSNPVVSQTDPFNKNIENTTWLCYNRLSSWSKADIVSLLLLAVPEQCINSWSSAGE